VLFVLKRDKQAIFSYAPIGLQTWQQFIPEAERNELPDSIVVIGEKGLLVKSQAALFVLNKLGGGYATLSKVLGIFPKFFADLVYDLVAKVRKKIFKTPQDVCPVVPEELRGRFLV
jgi:predicted DCC family thiol-disulfide oxidoreductase YuxK